MAIDVSYSNEYSRLRHVILYRPHIDEIEQDDIKKAMYIAKPNPQAVLSEFDNIAAKLRQLGVIVTILDGSGSSVRTPNMIYLRDVAFIFNNQIILARMKHKARSEEPAKFKRLLSNAEPSLVHQFLSVSDGSMEGADLLIKNNNTVLAYTGSRTSNNFVDILRQKLNISELINVPAHISGVPQHLLGGIHILDKDLLTRRVKYCDTDITGYHSIDFFEDQEITNKFSLNIITIGPREILMPANCNRTKIRLQAHGVICHEVEVSEIHKMGGGLACMVLPVQRKQD